MELILLSNIEEMMYEREITDMKWWQSLRNILLYLRKCREDDGDSEARIIIGLVDAIENRTQQRENVEWINDSARIDDWWQGFLSPLIQQEHQLVRCVSESRRNIEALRLLQIDQKNLEEEWSIFLQSMAISCNSKTFLVKSRRFKLVEAINMMIDGVFTIIVGKHLLTTLGEFLTCHEVCTEIFFQYEAFWRRFVQTPKERAFQSNVFFLLTKMHRLSRLSVRQRIEQYLSNIEHYFKSSQSAFYDHQLELLYLSKIK